jgi:hypothetical protein
MWPAVEYGDRAVEEALELGEGIPTALLPMTMLNLSAMIPCAQPVVVLNPARGDGLDAVRRTGRCGMGPSGFQSASSLGCMRARESSYARGSTVANEHGW